METGMIIIAAVLFAAVAVPTLLIIQNSKHTSKSLYRGITALLTQNNGVLAEHIEQSNFALGIDTNSKTIYFYKKTDEAETSQIIELSEIATCEIATKTRRIKKEKGHEEIVERIVLLFNTKKSNETKEIELYNEADSLLIDEGKIAEIWKNKVQHILSNKNVSTLHHTKQKLAATLA